MSILSMQNNQFVLQNLLQSLILMGNTNHSKIQQDIYKQYQIICNNNTTQILRHKSSNSVSILNVHTFIDKSKYEQITKCLNIDTNKRYKYLVNQFLIQKQQFLHLCTCSYKITTIYQFSEKSLQSEIQERRQQQKYFEQQNLLYILDVIIKCIRQSQNTNFININPKRILFMPNNKIKIAQTNVHLLNQDESFLEYLTPKYFQGISPFDLEQQLIFSTLMTILSAATLEDSYQCYDYKEQIFRYSLMQERLKICENRYSTQFNQLLSLILSVHEKLTFKEFISYNIINLFQLKIKKSSFSGIQWLSKSAGKTFQDINYSITLNSQSKSKVKNTTNSQQYNLLELLERDSFCHVKEFNKTTDQKTQKSQSTHESNIKNGPARIKYKDGSVFQGNFKYGKINGFGVLYNKDCRVKYQGYWKNDKFHGQGLIFNDNPQPLEQPFDYRDFTKLNNHWSYYRGQFNENNREGKGKLFLTNGESYEGEFIENKVSGKGEYLLENKIIRGRWIQSRLVLSQ